MAYAPRTWVDGEIVWAADQNRVENGIAATATTADAAAALAGTAVQPSDLAAYATTTALTDGLAGKQPVGSYATGDQGALADTAVQPATLAGYATTGALTTGLAGKANTAHTHAIGAVTGLQSALDGKQATGDYATTAALTSGLAGKVDTAGYIPVVSITQAAYDLLPTPRDSGILYVIAEA